MPEQPADPAGAPIEFPGGQKSEIDDAIAAALGTPPAAPESSRDAVLVPSEALAEGPSTTGEATADASAAFAPVAAMAPEGPAPDQEDVFAHPGESAEVDDLLHHRGPDFELHGDFEADVLTVQATQLPGRTAPGSRRRTSLVRRLGWGFWVAAGWCVIVILAAILAPVLPIPNPNNSTCLIPSAAPMAGHLLGCDDDARDVLSRVIWGGQVSLVVGFASIALALAVGGTLAVISGYLRGLFDSLSGIVANVILAFPYLVLGLAIVTFWGHSEFQVTVVIAIVAVAPLYRVVRASTISFAERDYVLAAMALGSTRRRILWKQVVPDVVPTAITYALVGVALAIVGEGALSFLGQSVPANTTPTWGNMIAEGTAKIPFIGTGVPVNIWLVLAPAIAMFTFILAINLIGDRLRTILDVREGVL